MKRHKDTKSYDVLSITRCEHGFLVSPDVAFSDNTGVLYAFSTFKEAVEFTAQHLDLERNITLDTPPHPS